MSNPCTTCAHASTREVLPGLPAHCSSPCKANTWEFEACEWHMLDDSHGTLTVEFTTEGRLAGELFPERERWGVEGGNICPHMSPEEILEVMSRWGKVE